MQKLLAKLKNVPRNAPLVPCSTRYMLNRDESLSAYNKVLTNNNLEVDLPVLESSGTELESLVLQKSKTFYFN